MKVTILAVGKLKSGPLKDLCDEYLKRMTWDVAVKEIKNTEDIQKSLPDKAFIIALDERGTSFSSPDFAQKLKQWRDTASGHHLYLLIGGADGFDSVIREKAKILLSFGQQTWPHMLVRVMILEQIYRSQQIISGHPYHRE